jgi:hypothetical protein
MRRITLVLAAAALMVAMLVAFSAPAMAKNNDLNHKQHSNNNHHQGFNDTVLVLGNGFGHNDDFEIELEDGDDDFEINLDDGNDVSVISPFFALGCWEWSWVFERWEWDCD